MEAARRATHILLLLLAVAAAAASLHAQQTAEPVVGAQDTAPRAAFDVVTSHRAVMDSAAQADRAVERLATVGGLAAELRESARRGAELQALLDALAATDYARPERVSRLRDQALLEDARLETQQARVLERLEQLGQIRARWLERQRYWARWRADLAGDPGLPAVAAEMRQAEERIAAVLASVAAATAQLIDLQRQAEELRSGLEGIAATVAAQRAERRRLLLRQTEPVLFSAAHRSQLADELPGAWRPPPLQVGAYAAFLREHAGDLLFYALLLVILGLAGRRIGGAARPEDGWSGLLERPWTLATFATAAVALQRVTLAPPLWDVLLWTVLGVTGSRLARHVLRIVALRVAVYVLAALYPLFLLMEAVQLPPVIFRVGLAAATAVVMLVFLVLARRTTTADTLQDQARRVWPLRVGAALWAAVLLALVLGYDVLGRWMLHATVTSAAVVFLVVLLLALLRGAIATLIRMESRAGGRVITTVGVPLAQRIMLLLQAVLVVGAVLALIDVWEIGPSPLATWQIIINAGFTTAGVRITVGRILFGAAVIYLAVLASWIVRSLVQSEVYQRWDFDRGVGDTISTVVHYTLVVFGVVIALGILGVQLQNFAIVAGALGIGIGFGLQNVVNNFVSGLILLFERPVRVGDTIVIAGEWGTVRKIGLRSTIMQTFDQSEMIVPNADLVSEKIVNWTLSNPIARLTVRVGVAYGSNIADVLDLLRRAGNAHDAALGEPPPQALFVGFGDSSLDFELRVWVREIRARLEVQSAVLTEIYRLLAEHGIEIPFPQRDIHLKGGSAADVLPAG